MNFLFLSLFLSVHRAQQSRSGWPSNVSPNFHRGGGQKVRNLALFLKSLDYEPPAFKNAARYLNSETSFFCSHDRPMFSPSLVKLGPRTPENRWAEMLHP